jgi:endonuclease/exonuclease/phosphatase family metal-dependent hydrolase
VDAADTTGNAATCTFPCGRADRRIDAFFVDPRITVRRYEVVDTLQARRASDHYPIVADLVLPAA